MSIRFGASALIAGTTIGAGMLAMPMTAANLGILGWIFLTFGFWVLMAFTGVVQVNINAHVDKPYSIATIAGLFLGKWGTIAGTISLVCLFYALLAAYATGASQVLSQSLCQIPFTWGALVYVVLFGVFVASCIKWVDYLNRVLMFIKTFVFITMVVLLIPHVQFQHMGVIGSPQSLFLAVPVFFTAFGFHGSVPSLFGYLNHKAEDLKKGVVLGSFFALILYVLWQGLTLGCLYDGINEQNLGLFVNKLSQVIHQNSLEWFVSLFIFLAITTSFLGVAIGLFEYLKEKFSSLNKEFIAILTFIPPLFFALAYPNGFIFALRFAAIFLSLLGVILPTLVALCLKQGSTPYKCGLWIALTLGVLVIICDVLGH